MEQSKQRRLFLKTALSAGSVGLAVTTGLLTPSVVLAEWPAKAFQSKKIGEALNNLYKSDAAADSDKISIDAPDVAENGAVVPVKIETSLDNVDRLSLLVSDTQSPLAASFDLQPAVKGMISIRTKVGKSGDLVAVVKSNGKLFTAKKAIKVTLGGC